MFVCQLIRKNKKISEKQLNLHYNLVLYSFFSTHEYGNTEQTPT